MINTAFDELNNLGSHVMIGGSDQTLTFYCVDANGAVLNITGATASLKMSPYGQPNSVSLTKSGVITNATGGVFTITFIAADTNILSGIYTFQPKVVAFDGTPYYAGQGLLEIIPLIA